jgi:hypothetical protein
MLKRNDAGFVARLAVAYFAFAEVLSLETSKWPACLVVSQYQNAKNQTGYETCATLHEGVIRLFWFFSDYITHDNVIAFGTVMIAVFTWTLWRSNVKLWSITNKSVDLARDDFNATHRPWISVTYAAITVGLSWAGRNAVVGLDVFVKNTGNSPAQRVSLAATIFPFLVNDDIPQEIARLQESHRTSTRRPIIERALFPGAQDDLIIPRVLVIAETKIASLKDMYGDPAVEMVPVILGSIEYYFSFGEREPHYTPFVFHLWRTAGSPNDRLTFRLDGSSVAKENMLLVELMSAGDPN